MGLASRMICRASRMICRASRMMRSTFTCICISTSQRSKMHVGRTLHIAYGHRTCMSTRAARVPCLSISRGGSGPKQVFQRCSDHTSKTARRQRIPFLLHNCSLPRLPGSVNFSVAQLVRHSVPDARCSLAPLPPCSLPRLLSCLVAPLLRCSLTVDRCSLTADRCSSSDTCSNYSYTPSRK